ncbi:ferrichrome ABC transporter permease [Gracilibacillus halophilus YIM-C55.5]|uniref:Ferrichrome ABC transporter permease n=1 Tax=Gracilibacillus halophilus YIM-C55.5 TaxID=1308866 RepID=N4WD19_9BACI|nr:ferrichrome ABC transporter permease [Gracilibacillus halophilus YIM-C55.5]
MRKQRFILILILCTTAIIISSLISLNVGTMNISPLEVWQTITGNGTEDQALVLFQFRLPGILLAILIGAGLATSGAVLQSITQNELAEPGIIGINAGAGFSIVLFIYFFQGEMNTDSLISVFSMPGFAFLGALVAAVVIYVLSWREGISPVRLILVGIGVNAAFQAALIIFQLKMDPQDFRQVTVWLSGDIWNTSWMFVWGLLPWMILLIPIVIWKYHALNVMTLTDAVASSLGARVEKERLILLVLAVSLAGASVAAGGGIAS